MNKHIWSAFAIVVMAILALGSTDSSNSSPTSSTIPTAKKSPPATSVARLESPIPQPNFELDRIFIERKASYEKDLAAWDQLSEKIHTLETRSSELQTKIKSLESEQPPALAENEERDWTSFDQKFRTVGVLIQTDYRVATIKKADGKTVTVPKEKFIDEDRRYIENSFIDAEVFRKKLENWKTLKLSVSDETSMIQARIVSIKKSKPVIPNRQDVAKELEAARIMALEQERSSSQTWPTSPPKQLIPAPIPKDVTYAITYKKIVPGIKRVLEIRLNKKVTREVLCTIAAELKNSDRNSYDRTFIGYYLPGMEVNAGYWASTHFTPDVEVIIRGLTVEEEETLKQKPIDPSRDVIGIWIDDFIGNQISIFRQDGKILLESAFGDGSSGTDELLEKKSPQGRRFEKVGYSEAGDHWIIDFKGQLEVRDNIGLIATAIKRK